MEAGLPATTRVENLLTSADRGDARATTVLNHWALPLRAAIDSIVAVLDPERVVLGGGLGRAAASALSRAPALSPWYQAPVVAAALGDKAGVIGGAWAAMNPEMVLP